MCRKYIKTIQTKVKNKTNKANKGLNLKHQNSQSISEYKQVF